MPQNSETFVLVQCIEPLKLLGSGVHSFEMDALSAIQHVLCVFPKLTCASRLPIITLTCHQLPVIDIIPTRHRSLGVFILIILNISTANALTLLCLFTFINVLTADKEFFL